MLQETRAVSEALGFVLIIGIVISGTSIYLSQQVPEWTKELEAEHADQLPLDFTNLDAAIDLAIVQADETIFTDHTIGMAAQHVPLIGMDSSGGTFTLDPTSERLELIAGIHELPPIGNGSWSSTADGSSGFAFSLYDTYQVITPAEGAQLRLEIGDDKRFSSGGDEYLAGEFWYRNFMITNGTTVYTSELAIHAMYIYIETGSSINADGSGSAGGKYDESGKGDGAGQNTGKYSTGGGGAGYGDSGGNGGAAYHYLDPSGWYNGGAGGSEYGHKTDVLEKSAGSGGAGGSCGRYIEGIGRYVGGKGGAGGGVVFLDAPTIVINGDISVNGMEGGDVGGNVRYSAGGGGGGGSGGCVIIKGDDVTITGMLSANGGDGGDGGDATRSNCNAGGGGGGGAGGRIKVYYDSEITPSRDDILNEHMVCVGGNGGDKGYHSSSYTGKDGYPGLDAGSGSSFRPMQVSYAPPVQYYDTGYLISNVTAVQGHSGYINLKNTAMICYGTISWDETIVADTNIIMKVRTSMYPDMSDALPWEECPEVSEDQDISELSSVSDGHPYIQWCAELVTFDLTKTPILHAVNISYSYGTPRLVNAAGIITFDSRYNYLPDYQIYYTHGGATKQQRDGEIVLFSPPISVGKQGNAIALRITAINITGGKEILSGALQTTLRTRYQDAAMLTGGLNFFNITIDVTDTAHPDRWVRWFNETCAAAGLNSGTDPGEYNISAASNSVCVVIYGNASNPVNLWLKRSTVSIEVIGG